MCLIERNSILTALPQTQSKQQKILPLHCDKWPHLCFFLSRASHPGLMPYPYSAGLNRANLHSDWSAPSITDKPTECTTSISSSHLIREAPETRTTVRREHVCWRSCCGWEILLIISGQIRWCLSLREGMVKAFHGYKVVHPHCPYKTYELKSTYIHLDQLKYSP